MSSDRSRRQFLLGSGTVGALALAGCVGTDDSSDDGGTDDDSMNDTGEDEMDGDNTDEEGSMDDDEDMDDDGMMSAPATVTVRIENVAPTEFYGSDASTGGAIWITPGAYAVHTGSNPIYTEGEPASVGLEALAEAGPPTGFAGEPGLVDELGDSMDISSSGAYTPENTVSDPNDPKGEVPGAPPIAPGGAFEFTVEAEPGQRLSFASMFVPSNDLFFSTDQEGVLLWPEDGEPVDGDVTENVGLYDAGTEPNGQPGFGPDQAPAQDSPTQGGDEGGVVRPVSEVADGYEYPAVEDAIQVTLTPQ